MKRSSRLIIALAALALSVTYYLPLWVIELSAPQYPEGLGLHIHINTITGQHPGDLAKINNLNHYIGMKKITPESIPELEIMPWIMRGLVIFGVLVALLNRKYLLTILLILFLAVAVIGFYDFYKWGYDYGHNLDTENAILKIPNMTYQPPIIGRKKLLNFTALSLPGGGGWTATASFVAMASVLFAEIRRTRATGG